MAELRQIGYQVYKYLKDYDISYSQVANTIGVSEHAVKNIVDGRYYLTMDELKAIAKIKDYDVNKFFEYEPSCNYPGLVHCMSSFSDSENCDKILDYIDLIASLEETIVLSREKEYK
ncbi:MAG: helix-turn-helix domain-containing protein [Sphaerochaetaceae bacterium]|nr:helix-turn-helix domain-containing protein [Sphaerochaetaceae bacterium]